MKIPTAMAAQIRTTRQITPMVRKAPESIARSNKPGGSGVELGVGCKVAALITTACVSVAGRFSTISGGSNKVGEGVMVEDGVTVGVSVKCVGVKVGGLGDDVLVGIGVRVGVRDLTGVFVRVGVLVAVGVGVAVAVGSPIVAEMTSE